MLKLWVPVPGRANDYNQRNLLELKTLNVSSISGTVNVLTSFAVSSAVLLGINVSTGVEN